MELSQLLLVSAVLIIAMMTILWLVSLALKNSSIVDIFWGTGFVIVNWIAFSFSQHTVHQTLLTILVSLWGLRLSVHIFFRNKGKSEDFRYALWRNENGSNWWWISFFKVFLLQGILLLIISTPLLTVQSKNIVNPFLLFEYVGMIIWFIGFFFESIGDYQLARFKSNPANKGKIVSSGLWRYTRHPNYFGDTVQWWGFFIFALSSGYWWTVFSPLLMTILLLRVSGVTLLEEAMKIRPGYEEYIRTTNAFFPWFPKR